MTTTTENPPVLDPPLPPLPPVPPVRQSVPSEPPYSLVRIFLGLIVVAATFDFCFWGIQGLGLSAALFFPVLALAIFLNRDKPWGRPSTLVISALLVGACVATAIEVSVTNALAVLILVILLAGNSFFDADGEAWARWFSQGVALVFAPLRALWLAGRVIEAGFTGGSGRVTGLIRGILLALPALVLILLFGGLLAMGNTVFGAWSDNFFDWSWKEIGDLLDFDRIALWGIVAFAVLPLLQPGCISDWWWRWIPRIPRLPELVSAPGAAFSSALMLVAMNALFAVANVADALFLWSGNKLPAGVTYSGYVHTGVDTLTFTVLLSAFVLTSIFQQQLGVAGRRGLKALGLLWIAQNLFVLVSVVLRLKLYIEAYDMTVARLSVIIFLLLVAAGYGLLAIKIVREKSLPWLVGGCAAAIFATFYVTQFLNLAGWSADYNVARWEQDRTRNLDLGYIYSLGSAGWPALQRAAADGKSGWNSDSYSDLSPRSQENGLPRTRLDAQHWREFSLRAYWNRSALEEKK